MTDELQIRRRRAAYRASHRGTKEMDFILGRYAETHLPGMSLERLADFERLIALPDPLLTQWFSQGAAPTESAFGILIAELRAFHGLAAAGAGGAKE